MITRELSIQHTENAVREATAWLIAGDSPTEWMAEILRWKLDESKFRLIAIPSARHQPGIGGLLVITGGPTPEVVPAAIPYGNCAGKLWLPVDAVLSPAQTDSEIAALCHYEAAVFHPVVGAIGCDALLRVSDLIAFPRERDEPWRDSPEIPVLPSRQINAIGWRVDESLSDLFEEEKKQIGNKPPTGLPKAEGEPGNDWISKTGRNIQKAGLNAMSGIMGALGGMAGAGVQQWLQNKLGAITEAMERSRNKELHRLLEQLRKNPEEGLRHALPLSSSSLNRGKAPPSTHLGNRDINFNFGRLGGGAPVDAWNIPYEIQRRLREEYIAAAEREKRLGHFRRAAYIYAELLGDLHSAAAALKEGLHWREAALIYRDLLQNPLEAAACFVEARMLNEAIALYEKSRAYESLGSLYRQIGEEDKAVKVYEGWAAGLVSQERHLEAAEIYLDKLGRRDVALHTLVSAWPHKADAGRCMDRWFKLREQAGEKDIALAQLPALRPADLRQHSALFVELCARLQRNYPDGDVRHLASDLGKKQIASVLPICGRELKVSLLHQLPLLSPEDRLLLKDAQRFLTKQPIIKDAVVPKPPPGEMVLSSYKDFTLPYALTEWHRAFIADREIVVFGTSGTSLVASRASYDGATQVCTWENAVNTSEDIWCLHFAFPGVGHYSGTVAYLGDLPGWKASSFVFPKDDRFNDTLLLEPTHKLAKNVEAVAGTQDVLWMLSLTEAEATLTAVKPSGPSLNKVPLDDEIVKELVPGKLYVKLLECSGDLFLAGYKMLYHLHFDSGNLKPSITEFEFDSITSIATPSYLGSPHVAVVTEHAVEVCWFGEHHGKRYVALGELEVPIACFTRDSMLVVLTAKAGYVMDCDSQGVSKRARFTWKGTPPVAVLPGPSACTFTIVEKNGRISTWLFSRGDLH